MTNQFPSFPTWLKDNKAHVDINRSDKHDLIPDGLTNTQRWVQSESERAISDATYRAIASTQELNQ